MNRRHAHKLGSTRSGLPLRNLSTSFCEARVKNISRTTPRVEESKGLAITGSPTEYLHGGDTSVCIGSVVVQVHSVGESHGPKLFIFHLRPMESSMNHHSSSFGDHNANSTFGNTILPFGSNPTISDILGILGNFLDKTLAFEDAIVGVVTVNGDTILETHTFKAVLGIDGVRSIECGLMLDMNKPRDSITKQHGATKLVLLGLSPSSVKMPSWDSRLQVITEHTVPRLKHSFCESSNCSGILGGSGCVVRGASLLSILTGSANRVVSGRVADKTQGKLIKVSPDAKLLNMCKCQMAEFNMPLEPNLLETGEISIVSV
jgi:hypothetical protein